MVRLHQARQRSRSSKNIAFMPRTSVLVACLVATASTAVAIPAAAQGSDPLTSRNDSLVTYGSTDPGYGFTVAKGDNGELRISAYGLFRFIDQLPGRQTYLDHLGRVRVIDTRQDVQWHRVLIYFKGWLYDPAFTWNMTSWTVNATGQLALVGNLRYAFSKHLAVAAGINGLPGTRTLRGNHPFWLAHDRVMSDEFIRPGFTSGVWAEGEMLPRSFYSVMLGANISQLGITAGEDSRNLSLGGSMWTLPTTGEFGPRDGFGDFEHHKQLATRLGFSVVRSRENRFTQVDQSPEPTQIKLQDALNLFDNGALANGVTVSDATYRELGIDGAAKYKGFFIGTEFGNRWLNDFVADGPLPVDRLHDWGFYVQTSYVFKPINLEPYASTSWVYGEKSKGFNTSNEFIGGLNWYVFDRRNVRLNTQCIWLTRSPVNSVFGYYVGGLGGHVISVDWSLLF
jgi:hypothetical protein